MMRRLVTLFFVGFPLVAQAYSVTVESGEHADFSRLVVQFSSEPDWVFGRVPGGYELRHPVDAELQTLEVFQKIPRSRIREVSIVGPGRLLIAVDCDCSGDAFEIRDGRVVLDIKDGRASPESEFEALLPELQGEDLWTEVTPADNRPADAHSLLALTATPQAPAAAETAFAQQAPEAAIPDLPAFAGAPVLVPFGTPLEVAVDLQRQALTEQFAEETDQPRPAGQELPQTLDESVQPEKGEMADVTGTDRTDPMRQIAKITPDTAKPANLVRPEFPPSLPISDASQTVTGLEAPREIHDIPGPVPTGEMTPTGPDAGIISSYVFPLTGHADPINERVETAQADLLQSLQRAAAQGLIEIATPIPDIPKIANETPKEAPPGQVDLTENLVGLEGDAHVRIQTSVDRDSVSDASNIPLTRDGVSCLPAEDFDVASWSEAADGALSLNALRADLIQEFDVVDADAAERLARRYVYLGFGAEARAALSAFPELDGRFSLLRELGHIVDLEAIPGGGQIAGQISCSTPAVLWAALAVPKISTSEVDTRALLRTVSGLPNHLRLHLAPTLSKRFLDAGDLETATQIRNLLQRSADDSEPVVELTGARIAEFTGDTEAANSGRESVVAADSPQSAEALAELIESKLNNGEQVSMTTARSADALAVEYRGTEIGRRLTRAAIYAFASVGNVETMFARIRSAAETGDIDDAEADELLAEAHARNVELSSDADFLLLAFTNPISKNAQDSQTDSARIAIADRLIDLGFLSAAQSQIMAANNSNTVSGRVTSAKLALAGGDLDAVPVILSGLTGPEPSQLRALAAERQQDFAAAARDYERAGDADGAHRAVWQGGNWEKAADHQRPEIAAAADLMLQPMPMDVATSVFAATEEQADAAKPLDTSRSLVSRSMETREILTGLLEQNSEN